MSEKNTLQAVVYGAAVGDALGVPYEGMARDTFECDGMVCGGAHGRPAGTFSDDTSLMLATCDSLRACDGRVDVADMRERFGDWLYRGAYTTDGMTFGMGRATVTALEQGAGCTDEYSNGNGSLMRIAPLAFTRATDEEIRAVSAITHAHVISTTSCVVFVQILRDIGRGRRLADAIAAATPTDERFGFMRNLARRPRDEVRSSGFVLDTLEASLWCALTTDTYASCVLTAVNLGYDTDTTACVAGALAGAMYGFESIPAGWMDELSGKDVIEACLFDPVE